MLNLVPDLRLGGSFSALKCCEWFSLFDWDRLYFKELEPPFVPSQDDFVNDRAIYKQSKKGIGVCEEIAKNINSNVENYMELDKYF